MRCGGGVDHRLGLGDEALVKERRPGAAPGVPVEVECDTVEQVWEAVAAGATPVLLDDMALSDTRAAVWVARDGR